MRYDRARKNLDRHPNYILAAYMASGTQQALARSAGAQQTPPTCTTSSDDDRIEWAEWERYSPGMTNLRRRRPTPSSIDARTLLDT